MNPVIKKIETFCKARNITHEELAGLSGLTTEQLSIIFQSDKIPSLSALIKISRGLGVRLGTFLDDNENFGPVLTRQAERNESATFTSQNRVGGSHMDFFSLASQKAGRAMEPFIIDIVPGEGNGAQPSSHEGEEFIFVLKGEVTVHYGNETYQLHQGDSIYYDSIVEHLVRAGSNELAQILAVVYSPM